MTDNSDDNNWRSKQIWIKDVLSKSGTELMNITKNGSNNANIKIETNDKQNIAKNRDKELSIKMVYYQSAPLNIKSEQPNQAQLCMQTLHTTTTALPPSAPATISTSAAMYQHANDHTNFNLPIMPTTQSINNAPTNLVSIKNELLPPSITGYSGTRNEGNTNIGEANIIAKGSAQPLPVATASSRKAITNKPHFKCEQCGMTFGSKSAHTSHTKSHAKNGEYDLNVNTQPPVAIEVNEAGVPLGIPKTPQIKPNANAAGGDPYQCNVCQKTFAVPARLIRHYRTHTGERPFECEFCHKLFSVKENLQVHRRIHTKERPYKCEVCGRAFEHSGKLHRHMRIHTGERPHKCSVCEKTFIQSGQLVIHMRTHTGEKPYKCPVDGCGKGFTCSKQLKVHSRTHTGEKPYHCDICFRDFGYNHVLKLHRVQHYGSKCYKCTICDETFKSKKEMEAHIKGHANEITDEEETANGGVTSSIVTVNASAALDSVTSVKPSSAITASSGAESISPPNSPQSISATCKVSKAKKPRQKSQRSVNAINIQSPPSPGSPSSSYSPSSSSFASASRLSAGSPTPSSISSPPISIQHETDHHSRDSGVASASNNVNYTPQQTHFQTQQELTYGTINYDDMPTDLRVPQHQPLQNEATNYYQPHPVPLISYAREEPTPVQQEQPVHSYQQPNRSNANTPTINSVLLEAATIASRRIIEEDVTQAAMQIMQLHRSQKQKPTNYTTLTTATNQQSSLHPHHASLLNSDLAHYDDTREANELIEHYKRGDLVRHVHKGYAPVPKFESSILDNEIIVRQVEAAIAPLRSSTESPERSSSPESDSMLMADRDIMTLPLRKRKVYMNEGPNGTSIDKDLINAEPTNTNGTAITNPEINSKVMRLSSVIQFAKAT